MPNDAPDWVEVVQVAVTVNNTPTIPDQLTELAAGSVGRYAGTDTTYQIITSWTVGAGHIGQLIEVDFTSSTFAHVLWKIDIGAVGFMADVHQGAPLCIPFHDLKLAAGTLVKVSCKSDDGSSINADAAIVAKEYY